MSLNTHQSRQGPEGTVQGAALNGIRYLMGQGPLGLADVDYIDLRGKKKLEILIQEGVPANPPLIGTLEVYFIEQRNYAILPDVLETIPTTIHTCTGTNDGGNINVTRYQYNLDDIGLNWAKVIIPVALVDGVGGAGAVAVYYTVT